MRGRADRVHEVLATTAASNSETRSRTIPASIRRPQRHVAPAAASAACIAGRGEGRRGQRCVAWVPEAQTTRGFRTRRCIAHDIGINPESTASCRSCSSLAACTAMTWGGVWDGEEKEEREEVMGMGRPRRSAVPRLTERSRYFLLGQSILRCPTRPHPKHAPLARRSSSSLDHTPASFSDRSACSST